MLLTHLRASDLLGKKVYDNRGRLLGEVVDIAGRHGAARAVVVRNEDKVVRLPRTQGGAYLKILH